MSSVSLSTLQLCRLDISFAKRFLALRERGVTQINLVFVAMVDTFIKIGVGTAEQVVMGVSGENAEKSGFDPSPPLRSQ